MTDAQFNFISVALSAIIDLIGFVAVVLLFLLLFRIKKDGLFAWLCAGSALLVITSNSHAAQVQAQATSGSNVFYGCASGTADPNSGSYTMTGHGWWGANNTTNSTWHCVTFTATGSCVNQNPLQYFWTISWQNGPTFSSDVCSGVPVTGFPSTSTFDCYSGTSVVNFCSSGCGNLGV